MTRPTDTDIRLRPDGSIDTAYYMARGRHMRSEAAHELMGTKTERRPRRRGLAGLFQPT